ncbi:ATP-binding protein [Flavobacterium sp. K5-23]|uniref:tetratricopeptide repeat-containing sensor histidine kinase n=1 Tax=Flavobacterium sp. K5-23 TaxID=2746225 RepID=UPI00200D9B69|nr:ATP-binding protein [Flavobacterium sp. K5-23]
MENNSNYKAGDSLDAYFSRANDFNEDVVVRKQYTQKALDIVLSQDNDSLHRVNLFKIANRYYNINDLDNYNKTVHLVLNRAESANDTLHLIKSYTYLGDYYESQSIFDSSFQFYNKADKMQEKLGNIINRSTILISKANLQYKAGDFFGSEQTVFKVLRLVKDEKKANNIFHDAYNLLGVNYGEMEEYDNALFFHNKALALSDDPAIPEVFQAKASTYNNLGFLFLNAKKNKIAKAYFIKGLEQPNLLLHKPYVYAMLLDNLAYSKLQLNENDGVLKLFLEALSLRENLQLTNEIFINKIHLSEYFTSINDSINALKYSQEALQLAKDNKVPHNILIALKQLAVVDPNNASNYTKNYIRVNDQIQKTERSMGEKFARIEYETDQIKNENTNLEVQNRNLVYVFSGLIILGMFFYIIKTQKNKNRVLLYKQQQQQANEEIYNLMISQQNTIEINRVKEKKRVAQELHDGVLGRMFGVRMNLDGLNRFNDDFAISQRISYLSELKNIEQDIREISHDLSREKSELINNFVAIVDNLFEEQRKTYSSSKLISSIDSKIKWELIKNSIKINLYRIIQESLQNINKYAKASSIKIVIKKIDHNLVLVISDNGIGFNTLTKKKGIGLENMQSRTNECNGEFKLMAKIGEGTAITVKVPIEQKQIPA